MTCNPSEGDAANVVMVCQKTTSTKSRAMDVPAVHVNSMSVLP